LVVPLQQYLSAASRALDRSAGVGSYEQIDGTVQPVLDTTKAQSRWDFGFASFQMSAGEIVSIIFPVVPQNEFHIVHYLNLLINDPGVDHSVIVAGIPPQQQSPISGWSVVDVTVEMTRGPNLLGLLDPAQVTTNGQHVRPLLLPPGAGLNITEGIVLVAAGPNACGLTWGREIIAPPGLTEITDAGDAPEVQIT